MRRKNGSWPKLISDSLRLGASASTVIALRMAKLAKGGVAAKRESQRMVDEKIKAALDAALDAARRLASGNTPQVPTRTLAVYQKHVAKNLRRLLKG